MVLSPVQLIRQATPGQRRTLLAAAMGWALDAFDAMLYSLVLALLMRDLGMSKTVAGTLGTLTLLASGIGGVVFGFLADRIGRKRALMASIADLLGVFVCLGPRDQHCHAGGRALRARPGHGRRVEYRSDASRRDLAHRSSSQGDFDRAKFVGAGLCGGGARGRAGGALLRMESGILCRHLACDRHALDSATRAGVGVMAAA